MSDVLSTPVMFGAIAREDLNSHLVTWGHRIGEVRRPTRGWSHGLSRDGELLTVVATDTLIRERVAELSRHEAIELSRICAVEPCLCRVALRLWRMFVFPDLCAQRGCRWALSYQDAAMHRGDLYRFDGWVRIGQSRSDTDPRSGRSGRRKVIWGWCDDPEERRRRSRGRADEAECLGLTAGTGKLVRLFLLVRRSLNSFAGWPGRCSTDQAEATSHCCGAAIDRTGHSRHSKLLSGERARCRWSPISTVLAAMMQSGCSFRGRFHRCAQGRCADTMTVRPFLERVAGPFCGSIWHV